MILLHWIVGFVFVLQQSASKSNECCEKCCKNLNKEKKKKVQRKYQMIYPCKKVVFFFFNPKRRAEKKKTFFPFWWLSLVALMTRYLTRLIDHLSERGRQLKLTKHLAQRQSIGSSRGCEINETKIFNVFFLSWGENIFISISESLLSYCMKREVI